MHPAILPALLASVALWTSGALLRFSTSSLSTLGAALEMILAGVLPTSTLWLAVAAHHTRSRLALRPLDWLAMSAPPSALFLALLTNDGHRLVVREVSFASLEASPAGFAGARCSGSWRRGAGAAWRRAAHSTSAGPSGWSPATSAGAACCASLRRCCPP
jgi:hypothetical protein